MEMKSGEVKSLMEAVRLLLAGNDIDWQMRHGHGDDENIKTHQFNTTCLSQQFHQFHFFV